MTNFGQQYSGQANQASQLGTGGPKQRPGGNDKNAAIALSAFAVVVAAVIVLANVL